MNKLKAEELLQKYRLGQCSPEEIDMLDGWYMEVVNEANHDLFEFEIQQELDQLRLATMGDQQKGRSAIMWPSMAAAAVILFFLSFGIYYYLKSNVDPLVSAKTITPAVNLATLTLSNGKKIILTGAPGGQLARQRQTIVSVAANGQLVYHAGNQLGLDADPKSIQAMNTLTTPRKGHFQVVLPDGSQVWLNASSSITFPVAFTGKSREVNITGEAYFEIVHDKSKPFRVSALGQTVEVLGTHFDVNAYPDEPAIRTTLFQGKVKVSKANSALTIVPGQEAIASKTDGKLTSENADLEKALAWKNGVFIFNGDNVQPIMRQIVRWYDVEVDYQGTMSDKNFVGSVSRFDNLADVLKTLELTGTVHFKTIGRRVTVIAN